MEGDHPERGRGGGGRRWAAGRGGQGRGRTYLGQFFFDAHIFFGGGGWVVRWSFGGDKGWGWAGAEGVGRGGRIGVLRGMSLAVWVGAGGGKGVGGWVGMGRRKKANWRVDLHSQSSWTGAGGGGGGEDARAEAVGHHRPPCPAACPVAIQWQEPCACLGRGCGAVGGGHGPRGPLGHPTVPISSSCSCHGQAPKSAPPTSTTRWSAPPFREGTGTLWPSECGVQEAQRFAACTLPSWGAARAYKWLQFKSGRGAHI